MTSQPPERTPFDWENRFRQGAAPWERDGLHPAFLAWKASGEFDGLGSVFIPGCGRAPEVAAFAGLGIATAAGDIAPTAIAWQREALARDGLEADLIEGDTFANVPDAAYDGVYEQTFLCAIPPRLRADYEAAAHRWLKPGGRLFALFMQKEEMGGPPYGCALPAMRDLFAETRWMWPEGEATPWPHPSLGVKAELGVILTRKA